MMSRDEIDDEDADDDWRRRMVRRAHALARPDCVAQRIVTDIMVVNAGKKLSSGKSSDFFQPKLRSWVLLSPVLGQKKSSL